MPAYRYYCPHLSRDSTSFLEGSEFEHLHKVMRQGAGDRIELIDGKGQLAQAVLTLIEKKKAHFEIEGLQSFQLDHSLVLYQAIPSWSHLEWMVEKAVELGLNKLVLFPSTHSPYALSEKKKERLLLKAVSALKQSGRLFLTEFIFLKALADIQVDSAPVFFGDLSQEAPLLNFEEYEYQNSTLSFANGPESGFTTSEQEELKKKGFKGVSIHTNILRTETAPLSFLSLAHHYLMLKRKAPLIN